MAIKIVFRNKNAPQAWKDAMTRRVQNIATASTMGARAAALDIEREGRLNIAQSGRFGPRWQKGFQTRVFPQSGVLINSRIEAFHTELGANVHEYGATIQGKPLLWLPLSFTGITIRARDWAKQNGGLFRVDRAGGKPLLLSVRDHQPKFVGVRSVTIRKRWDLRGVCNKVMANFVSYYNKALSAAVRGK